MCNNMHLFWHVSPFAGLGESSIPRLCELAPRGQDVGSRNLGFELFRTLYMYCMMVTGKCFPATAYESSGPVKCPSILSIPSTT